MMVPETNVNGISPICALCGGQRSHGSHLPSRVGMVDPALWVCVDCQHKLARRVDDEGALGG